MKMKRNREYGGDEVCEAAFWPLVRDLTSHDMYIIKADQREADMFSAPQLPSSCSLISTLYHNERMKTLVHIITITQIHENLKQHIKQSQNSFLKLNSGQAVTKFLHLLSYLGREHYMRYEGTKDQNSANHCKLQRNNNKKSSIA